MKQSYLARTCQLNDSNGAFQVYSEVGILGFLVGRTSPTPSSYPSLQCSSWLKVGDILQIFRGRIPTSGGGVLPETSGFEVADSDSPSTTGTHHNISKANALCDYEPATLVNIVRLLHPQSLNKHISPRRHTSPYIGVIHFKWSLNGFFAMRNARRPPPLLASVFISRSDVFHWTTSVSSSSSCGVRKRHTQSRRRSPTCVFPPNSPCRLCRRQLTLTASPSLALSAVDSQPQCCC